MDSITIDTLDVARSKDMSNAEYGEYIHVSRCMARAPNIDDCIITRMIVMALGRLLTCPKAEYVKYELVAATPISDKWVDSTSNIYTVYSTSDSDPIIPAAKLIEIAVRHTAWRRMKYQYFTATIVSWKEWKIHQLQAAKKLDRFNAEDVRFPGRPPKFKVFNADTGTYGTYLSTHGFFKTTVPGAMYYELLQYPGRMVFDLDVIADAVRSAVVGFDHMHIIRMTRHRSLADRSRLWFTIPYPRSNAGPGLYHHVIVKLYVGSREVVVSSSQYAKNAAHMIDGANTKIYDKGGHMRMIMAPSVKTRDIYSLPVGCSIHDCVQYVNTHLTVLKQNTDA